MNIDGLNGKHAFQEKKKEETMYRLKAISELVLQYIFRILDKEDFESALVDYNNSIVYNFIVHVFNSLSMVNVRDGLVRTTDDDEIQMVKDPRKLEIFGFKFLYKVVKRFQSTKINELIYNLISSKFSLKVSLNEMKHYVNQLEEKKSQKVIYCVSLL